MKSPFETEEPVSKVSTGYVSTMIVVLLAVIIILTAVCKIKTDRFNVETVATKISEVNLNDDRELIGYADTVNGTARVYDKTYRAMAYVTTYQYTDGNEFYEFIYKSQFKPADTMRIYYDENNPEEICFASDKVSLKELTATN